MHAKSRRGVIEPPQCLGISQSVLLLIWQRGSASLKAITSASDEACVENGMGFRNPCGSWVWVGMGTGRDSPTCKLQNKPLFIQNLMVLNEKRLVLKGIPMGSRVQVWVKCQIPMGLPMPFARHVSPKEAPGVCWQ